MEGKCLEQPAEPDSSFKDKIQHPAYPCQELGGLIFAYLGPMDKMPLLPRYEVLAREDGIRKVEYYLINSNYLQNVEGALDTVHSSYLHRDNWSKVKHKLALMPKPKVEFVEADYGIWQKTYLTDINLGIVRQLYSYFFMPAGFVRVPADRDEKGCKHKFQSWYVPIDDSHTVRFQVEFATLDRDGKPYQWRPREDYVEVGPENDYFRDYDAVDTISGIPVRTAASTVKGFLAQDSMVNETQGPIVNRSQEHLGQLDKVLTAMRIMYLLAVEDVRRGSDPKHIIRDPAKNEVVYISGSEELEVA